MLPFLNTSKLVRTYVVRNEDFIYSYTVSYFLHFIHFSQLILLSFVFVGYSKKGTIWSNCFHDAVIFRYFEVLELTTFGIVCRQIALQIQLWLLPLIAVELWMLFTLCVATSLYILSNKICYIHTKSSLKLLHPSAFLIKHFQTYLILM